jgi:hypothetical protein
VVTFSSTKNAFPDSQIPPIADGRNWLQFCEKEGVTPLLASFRLNLFVKIGSIKVALI